MAVDPLQRFKDTVTPEIADVLATMEQKARAEKPVRKVKKTKASGSPSPAPVAPGLSPQEILDRVKASIGERPKPSPPLGPEGWGMHGTPQQTTMGPGERPRGVRIALPQHSTT